MYGGDGIARDIKYYNHIKVATELRKKWYNNETYTRLHICI